MTSCTDWATWLYRLCDGCFLELYSPQSVAKQMLPARPAWEVRTRQGQLLDYQPRVPVTRQSRLLSQATGHVHDWRQQSSDQEGLSTDNGWRRAAGKLIGHPPRHACQSGDHRRWILPRSERRRLSDGCVRHELVNDPRSKHQLSGWTVPRRRPVTATTYQRRRGRRQWQSARHQTSRHRRRLGTRWADPRVRRYRPVRVEQHRRLRDGRRLARSDGLRGRTASARLVVIARRQLLRRVATGAWQPGRGDDDTAAGHPRPPIPRSTDTRRAW